jgi:hypothetical protein
MKKRILLLILLLSLAQYWINGIPLNRNVIRSDLDETIIIQDGNAHFTLYCYLEFKDKLDALNIDILGWAEKIMISESDKLRIENVSYYERGVSKQLSTYYEDKYSLFYTLVKISASPPSSDFIFTLDFDIDEFAISDKNFKKRKILTISPIEISNFDKYIFLYSTYHYSKWTVDIYIPASYIILEKFPDPIVDKIDENSKNFHLGFTKNKESPGLPESIKVVYSEPPSWLEKYQTELTIIGTIVGILLAILGIIISSRWRKKSLNSKESIREIEGIGEKRERLLNERNIFSKKDLKKANPDKLGEETGIPKEQILEWQKYC